MAVGGSRGGVTELLKRCKENIKGVAKALKSSRVERRAASPSQVRRSSRLKSCGGLHSWKATGT